MQICVCIFIIQSSHVALYECEEGMFVFVCVCVCVCVCLTGQSHNFVFFYGISYILLCGVWCVEAVWKVCVCVCVSVRVCMYVSVCVSVCMCVYICVS